MAAAAAKKTAAKTSKKVTNSTTFQITDRGMDSNGAKQSYLTYDYGTWVTVKTPPQAVAADPVHFYIVGKEVWSEPGIGGQKTLVEQVLGREARLRVRIGKRDRTTITLDKAVPVGPPINRFEDNAERRAENKTVASVIETVMNLMLGHANRAEATKSLRLMCGDDSKVTINVTTDPDPIATVTKAMETAKPFREAVEGLTSAQRLSVLRFIAHYFDIPKGDTSLR